MPGYCRASSQEARTPSVAEALELPVCRTFMRILCSLFRDGFVLLLVILASSAVGCSSGATPVPVPRYDPDGMAHAAMEEYDKNRDGKLDAAELERCPALKN